MPIKFRCESCGARLVVKDELAGKRGKCPACGETEIVPDPGDTGPALGEFSAGQRKLIEKYPSMRDYLRPPGRGFDSPDAPKR